jgi:nitroimidazol reductase NimA-like FMN-containing flavoprotein (pyridoxamine 5'-phosphate oxidase superfamily)
MSEYHEQRAGEIIQRILYVTIATVSSEGIPWNSPVYSAYDHQANFYWTSSPQAQHSRNIDGNGKVFLAIYDSTVPEGKGEGVYVEGIAAALEAPAEIAEAKRNMALRVGKQLGPETDRLLAARLQRIYRATPSRVWMNGFENDEHGRYGRDIRVEIPVACLKGLVNW